MKAYTYTLTGPLMPSRTYNTVGVLRDVLRAAQEQARFRFARTLVIEETHTGEVVHVQRY